MVDRPWEDIVRLVTLLEESPQYARVTGAALRAAGVNRSVEDVTWPAELLTRPPRATPAAPRRRCARRPNTARWPT
ncbi:hypothetical protein ABZT03_19720 [Streptomyces sp. NPDC005574]|uniref:hypothetical protein n=1 Tax=Streptomyces sp. NPDC005574 TaxID=3156891 RepID=UPI0033B87E9B